MDSILAYLERVASALRSATVSVGRLEVAVVVLEVADLEIGVVLPVR